MSSTKDMVAKAIQTTESLSSAGALDPIQSEKFATYVFDLSQLLKNTRHVFFRNEEWKLEKLGLGRRVAMAKVEAQDPQKRRNVSHNKITLAKSEIVVPIEISDKYLRRNLEGRSAEDVVLEMMATQLGNDLEDLAINGNTLGPAALGSEMGFDVGFPTNQEVKDDYLALQDGWSLRADSGNIYDAANAVISPTIFSKAMQAMPEKFKRDMASMGFLLPTNIEMQYIERVGTRLDAAGVAALNGGQASSFGARRMAVPLWTTTPRVVEHVVLPGTTAVALKSKNMTNVKVHPAALADIPTTKFVSGVNYTLDAAAGTIARIAVAGIGDGDTVKVTYDAKPQMLFTNMNNLIVGFGLENIRLLRDSDIYKDVAQYALHVEVGFQIEEVEAIVKVKNLAEVS